MAEPMSWVAIDAICARLATITIANGYRTDLGLSPIRPHGHKVVSDAADTRVIEEPDGFEMTVQGKRVGASAVNLVVDHAVSAASDPTAAARFAHHARADLLRCLAPAIAGMPSGITSLTIEGASVSASAVEGTPLMNAQVRLRVGLSETY